MAQITSKYFTSRQDWRQWLEDNFSTREDIWLEFPLKKSGKKRLLYNDAVEEALCFGWIDSTVKSLNDLTTIQRFCRRRKNSPYSQANIERLRYLYTNKLIHEFLRPDVAKLVQQKFTFPEDIVAQLQSDPVVWQNYQKFSAPYQRIRIAYIDSARKRPAEFEKRLNNFIAQTRENKIIKGYGGIDKYY